MKLGQLLDDLIEAEKQFGSDIEVWSGSTPARGVFELKSAKLLYIVGENTHWPEKERISARTHESNS